MNADEIVKMLRNDSHFGCPVWHEKYTQLNEAAADLIESLQAENEKIESLLLQSIKNTNNAIKLLQIKRTDLDHYRNEDDRCD